MNLGSKKCIKPLENPSIITGQKYSTLSNGTSKKEYPSSIKLIKDQSIDSGSYVICYKRVSENFSVFGFEDNNTSPVFFAWNLNSYAKELEDSSKDNIVYTNKQSNSDPKFDFKNFEWPLNKPYFVFISIIINQATLQYTSEVVFFDKENNLFYVSYKKKDTKVIFDKLPTEVIHNINSLNKSNNATSIILKNTNAAYLSDTEVVYQIKSDKLIECKLSLIKENVSTLKINCEKGSLSSKDLIPYEKSKLLTEGLSRVISQANRSVVLGIKPSVKLIDSKTPIKGNSSESTKTGGSTQSSPRGLGLIV